MTIYDIRDKVKARYKDLISKTFTPNTTVEYAIFDAVTAFKASSDAKNRSFGSNSIAIDGRCIRNGYIYPSNTRKFANQKYTTNKSSAYKNMFIKRIRKIKTTKVCRLCFDSKLSKYTLVVPVEADKPKEPEREFISLDPGIRTFMTYYDGESWGEIGKNLSIRLVRLNLACDTIQAKIAKSSGYKKRKLKIAIARVRKKIKNIVKDLHFKTRSFLRKYKYILLPEFKVKGLMKPGKLHVLTRRALADLSHFTFRLRLAQSSSKLSKVILCNEAYTSKTCTNCGTINSKLGGKKVFACSSCKLIIDRDLNGARNVLLRVLSSIEAKKIPGSQEVEGPLLSFDVLSRECSVHLSEPKETLEL